MRSGRESRFSTLILRLSLVSLILVNFQERDFILECKRMSNSIEDNIGTVSWRLHMNIPDI